jgi:chromosome segregation ATPase
MSTDDHLFFQNAWQHIMGSLDRVLEDARGNAASLHQSHSDIDRLLEKAEQERERADAALRELAARRREMVSALDEVQRELAVAGLPLRGEIT